MVPPRESSVVVKPEALAWDSSAGPALFVAGAIPQQALIVPPRYTSAGALDSVAFDAAAVQSIRLDLFGIGQRVGSARILDAIGGSRTDSCRSWPTARLQIASDDTGSVPSWNVAFEAGRAAALVVDSIEALATPDSARLAAEIARLASAVPKDTSAVFRGLPFVVNKAWRAQVPPSGLTLLAAVVVRNVNQEANPRQERILLIAERDSIGPPNRFVTRYTERISGPEETLETTDPVAVLRLGADQHPTIVVSRDSGRGFSYVLIERIAGQWRQRWASAYAGC